LDYLVFRIWTGFLDLDFFGFPDTGLIDLHQSTSNTKVKGEQGVCKGKTA
jgi:hypothetical protein